MHACRQTPSTQIFTLPPKYKSTPIQKQAYTHIHRMTQTQPLTHPYPLRVHSNPHMPMSVNVYAYVAEDHQLVWVLKRSMLTTDAIFHGMSSTSIACKQRYCTIQSIQSFVSHLYSRPPNLTIQFRQG